MLQAKTSEDFFKNWTPQMAYVLGYFCADGSMFINPRGSKYVSFYSTDKNLLLAVKRILGCKNKLTVRKNSNKNWKDLFSLQIGSKKMYSDLLNLGLMPAKAKRLSIPNVPKECLRHFVRGYFDGDGCVSFGSYRRKGRLRNNFSLMVRFACGSRNFLETLSNKLSVAGLGKGGISENTSGYHLVYAKNDSGKLFDFMYNRVPKGEYLERKYNKFREAFKLLGAVA